MMPDDGVQVKFCMCTKEQYNDIPEKDPNTIYFISDDPEYLSIMDQYKQTN